MLLYIVFFGPWAWPNASSQSQQFLPSVLRNLIVAGFRF